MTKRKKIDHEDKLEFCSQLVLMKVRAGQLGLFKTLRALDAATKAVGFEEADHRKAAAMTGLIDRLEATRREVV